MAQGEGEPHFRRGYIQGYNARRMISMKMVIATRMTVEWDLNADSENDMIFTDMPAPSVFSTMEEAKSGIEETIKMEYADNARYNIRDIVRCSRNGEWNVTVLYYGGKTEFHATEIVFNQI